MKRKTGQLTLAGILTALALVCLLLTISPMATVGLAALAALCGIPVVIELGRPAGLLHYGAVAVLSLLLIPSVAGKGMYILFFGWYTIFKSYIEGKNLPRPTEWLLKLAAFFTAVLFYGGIWVFLLKMLLPLWLTAWMFPLVAVALGIVFVLYDMGLSGLITAYFARIRPKIQGIFRF